MADRIVYPDEVNAAKAEALEKAEEKKVEEVKSNSVDESQDKVEEPPQITMRNVIVVPGNCPAGYQMGADGVCREIM
ncbi:uncharacterized protein LOC128683803 [Plodia interpunctella]|uniref:uncharacterized protein LOC128683803 n=1 Tax=Plodia interpunctella TaxID=58824 RepID=UPI00236819F1|nr:uncharacterized protein LOC128683803 [Plodia interpunctella]